MRISSNRFAPSAVLALRISAPLLALRLEGGRRWAIECGEFLISERALLRGGAAGSAPIGDNPAGAARQGRA